MGKHAQSIDTAILDRIQSKGTDYVFSAADFLDLGSRAAVDQVLSRSCRTGVLGKVARGLYHVPRNHALLGRLAPSVDDTIKAIARRDGVTFQSSGAQCANDLGLCDQVPMRRVYLTSGRSRRFHIGRIPIMFKHTSPRHMATAGTVSGHVIQALRWIGRRYADDQMVARLRRNLNADHKAQLLRDVRHAPVWVADIMRRVAAPTNT
jgi:hypothetical protein